MGSILCKVVKETLFPYSLYHQLSTQVSPCTEAVSHSFSGLSPQMLIVSSLQYANHSLFQPKALRLFFASVILHIPVIAEEWIVCSLLFVIFSLLQESPGVSTEVIVTSNLIYLVLVLLLSSPYRSDLPRTQAQGQHSSTMLSLQQRPNFLTCSGLF